MLSFHTKVFAHRGLHNGRGSAPENSLAAFRRAVDAGWGIELDIQLSKDRQVVVFHDASLNRMCGVCGRVRDYTWEELCSFRLGESEERIPLLSEVLALVEKENRGSKKSPLCRFTPDAHLILPLEERTEVAERIGGILDFLDQGLKAEC